MYLGEIKMVEKILNNYNIDGELISVEQNNSGNINKTYIATFLNNGEYKKYLVQKINTNVFPEPYKLMSNIEKVTKFIKKEQLKQKDNEHKTLDVIKTNKNELLCEVGEDKEYYRIYEFIENAIAYNYSTDYEIVKKTGEAFGNFQKMLSNYPMNQLEETIKDFHNTKKRLQQLYKDIKIDSKNRATEVAELIVFILKREDICGMIIDKLETGEIPLRVTHNDTKVNNVLMNKETKDYLAVIDLDTVMPGSLLFDYGDGIRSTASNAKEDETELSKVYINLDLFEAYTDGYMSEMADNLTDEEIALMGESIRIITLELGIRFLNDYINGDTYFKIEYDKHNLDRAINQLALVKNIEDNLDYINSYIYESYKKHKNDYTKAKNIR